MIKVDLFNIIFTVVNLLILFVAFRIFFFKPLRNIIAKRQEEADEMFDKATAQEQAASDLKTEYEEKLVSAETEKKQILAEARKSADGEYQQIVADAKKEAKKLQKEAVSAAEHQKSEIIGSAKKEIAQMVVEATTKVVGKKAGADVDSELFDEFLGKAGE